jgi:hypothetical protein
MNMKHFTEAAKKAVQKLGLSKNHEALQNDDNAITGGDPPLNQQSDNISPLIAIVKDDARTPDERYDSAKRVLHIKRIERSSVRYIRSLESCSYDALPTFYKNQLLWQTTIHLRAEAFLEKIGMYKDVTHTCIQNLTPTDISNVASVCKYSLDNKKIEDLTKQTRDNYAEKLLRERQERLQQKENDSLSRTL